MDNKHGAEFLFRFNFTPNKLLFSLYTKPNGTFLLNQKYSSSVLLVYRFCLIIKKNTMLLYHFTLREKRSTSNMVSPFFRRWTRIFSPRNKKKCSHQIEFIFTAISATRPRPPCRRPADCRWRPTWGSCSPCSATGSARSDRPAPEPACTPGKPPAAARRICHLSDRRHSSAGSWHPDSKLGTVPNREGVLFRERSNEN